MTILAVFRSRAQTLQYLSILKQNGVSAQAVNTPKEARVGCGISAKFDERALFKAKLLLKKGSFTTFAGFYRSVQGGYFKL